jgi:hypothetical protein
VSFAPGLWPGPPDLPHKANQNRVAPDVPRTVPSEVDIRGDDAATIAPHHLHGDGSPALQTATHVASVPGEAQWDLGVNACMSRLADTSGWAVCHPLTDGGKDGASVLHAGICAAREERKAENRNKLEPKQEDTPLSRPVRKPAGPNGEDASKNVRRDLWG